MVALMSVIDTSAALRTELELEQPSHKDPLLFRNRRQAALDRLMAIKSAVGRSPRKGGGPEGGSWNASPLGGRGDRRSGKPLVSPLLLFLFISLFLDL